MSRVGLFGIGADTDGDHAGGAAADRDGAYRVATGITDHSAVGARAARGLVRRVVDDARVPVRA